MSTLVKVRAVAMAFVGGQRRKPGPDVFTIDLAEWGDAMPKWAVAADAPLSADEINRANATAPGIVTTTTTRAQSAKLPTSADLTKRKPKAATTSKADAAKAVDDKAPTGDKSVI